MSEIIILDTCDFQRLKLNELNHFKHIKPSTFNEICLQRQFRKLKPSKKISTLNCILLAVMQNLLQDSTLTANPFKPEINQRRKRKPSGRNHARLALASDVWEQNISPRTSSAINCVATSSLRWHFAEFNEPNRSHRRDLLSSKSSRWDLYDIFRLKLLSNEFCLCEQCQKWWKSHVKVDVSQRSQQTWAHAIRDLLSALSPSPPHPMEFPHSCSVGRRATKKNIREWTQWMQDETFKFEWRAGEIEVNETRHATRQADIVTRSMGQIFLFKIHLPHYKRYKH